MGITFWSLRSGRGEIEGLIGVCQDLSLIKQMEQRMRQADRLATVGRLSANMAHEIRNPLASISGAVEALSKELPPDQHRNRLVEIVLRESSRLNDLVGDFLEYARPAPISPIDVDMAELLDEVLLLLEHRSLPPNLKIVREYGEALMVRVDPQQMRQAVWNLCLNAVQAMPEAGGDVRVGARVSAEQAGHAPGVDRRHRTGHQSGGPATHLRAVLLHQARGKRPRPRDGLPRDAGSRRPGRGSNAVRRGYDLHPQLAPCHRRGAVRAVPHPDEATMSAARVLIVDDEKSMRDLLTITLEKAGYEVTAADGGEAAIDVVRKENFDAIITDLRMPKVDGLQVLRAAKDLSPTPR